MLYCFIGFGLGRALYMPDILNEKKSRLTPGEIEAIKAMRATPHIPEDAKLPLPEVY